MFVNSDWSQFCSAIKSENTITVCEIPKQDPSQKWVCIKHDVETNVEKALAIAKIEAENSIRATYFVQSYLLKENVELLKQIQRLGHEVTYHYDVLDANYGDYELALKEFDETLKQFESEGFSVKSVCPHGNPMMNRNGWSSNKDFFRNPDVSVRYKNIFDLVVQAREKVFGGFVYVSDAGFSFKIISDIVENDRKITSDTVLPDIKALIQLVHTENSIVVSTHPHRWSPNFLKAYFAKFRFVVIRKIALSAAKFPLARRVMSKFYFLAKKL